MAFCSLNSLILSDTEHFLARSKIFLMSSLVLVYTSNCLSMDLRNSQYRYTHPTLQ